MSAISNRISVIIVTHNSMPLLRDCLSSLKAAGRNIDYNIVLVDNNSADLSPSVARTLFPNMKILINRENLGFAAACNQGAAAADGEFLLFLNPDVRVDEDGIENLQAVFSAKDRIGWATARLRYPDGTFQPTCRRMPAVHNILFSRGSFFGSLMGGGRSSRTNRYTLPDYLDTTIVDAVSGTMVMIRRNLFSRVGGFDERFFMYMEDTDLSLRLTEAGYVNVFVPDAGGVHFWRRGSNAGRVRRIWYHHCSMWKYFRKHFHGRFLLVLLSLLLGVNFVLAVLFQRPSRTGQ